MRLITAIMDGLAACARIVFEAGLGIMHWHLDRMKERREERERRHQDDARK